MRLDHSVETRRDYDRQHTGIGGWAPEDLQISSYRAVARKTVNPIRRLFSSGKKNESPNRAKSDENKNISIQAHTSPSLLSKEPTPQPQSPLFRLPIELRQEIYKLVLGHSNIHIVLRHGNQIVRHTRCTCASCPGFATYPERGMSSWQREWKCDTAKYDYGGDRVSPQLLRTCREVYAEAIEFLYSSNIFSFRSPYAVERFVGGLTPENREEVRAFHLDLKLPSLGAPKDSWKTIHDMLPMLPGLRELEIRVHCYRGPRAAREEQGLDLLRKTAEENENFPKTRLYLPIEVLVHDWMHEAPFEVYSVVDWQWLKERSPWDMWQIVPN
ncbi:uncharacterized protein BDZ99DRAFT_464801 [Mytilinidion resinicola]|uniref:DUF7730 domain-containing protein n=1 Tax=Mytilinidion resinicola TaxID=574789 RepID=A0A6A6YGG9_9PEZI|nr:uncharacterized protein BDZ99DRAFT_464801 [Mytilinidion resinicola]KAF2807902.1 hypothetical protein BDZ99DRAFT_464801 [Mytilinidion resinicola]